MGAAIAKLWKKLAGGPKPLRILMVGLDNAGKTTILYKLKIGEVVTTIPTIGFNVENVEYKNLKFTVWDVGGQQSIRQLWKHYYSNTDGIIFVIDANDTKRIRGNEHCGIYYYVYSANLRIFVVININNLNWYTAKEELHRLMSEVELENCILLVLANKQDLPNAKDEHELAEILDLEAIKQKNHIQGTIAHTAEGLFEGLDWLSEEFGGGGSSNKKSKSSKKK